VSKFGVSIGKLTEAASMVSGIYAVASMEGINRRLPARLFLFKESIGDKENGK